MLQIRLKLPDCPAEESHVESLILDAKLDPQVRSRLEGFSVDPTDVAAFRMLEEELFLGGSWALLAGVYERRLSALEPGSADWRDLLFRLGELLEDRIGDVVDPYGMVRDQDLPPGFSASVQCS